MIYVTADTHFNHKNICQSLTEWEDGGHGQMTCRPFDTLDSMNTYIIQGINREVQPDDELYHLGDFAFGDKSQIPALRERINCNTVHLIMGNHDYKLVDKKPYLFAGFASIEHYKQLYYHKILFSMMHYPLGSWNEIGRGGVNLHGHCHNNYKRTTGRQMDVGYDAIGAPMSIMDIYGNMMNIEPELVDGHDENTNYG